MDAYDIRAQVLGTLSQMNDPDDEQVRSVIDSCIFDSPLRSSLCVEGRRRLAKELFDEIRRLGVLSAYLDDADVTEIMVNGPENIFIEKNGRLVRCDRRFESPRALEDLIQQIVSDVNRRVNEASPIVDARLPGGERVNIVLEPIALDGPVMTIRKFSGRMMSLGALIENGSITQQAADFLAQLVKTRYSIIISGGTSSGKTTLLGCLAGFVSEDERVVTIEDSAELHLPGLNNIVRLETRNSDLEGVKSVSVRDLIKASLRMRPDRIIVGEVRGGEAVDLLAALNTGHEGALSTLHANNPADTIKRLETMCLMSGVELPLAAIRGQIASAVDIIVQVSRFHDGRRRVTHICEVGGYVDGEVEIHSLFELCTEEGNVVLKKTGELKNTARLSGYY